MAMHSIARPMATIHLRQFQSLRAITAFRGSGRATVQAYWVKINSI